MTAYRVNFYEQGETHPDDCAAPQHLSWVMGIYDQHGILLASKQAITCSDDLAGLDLDQAAQANARFWPGSYAYLWLDTSLIPTEHLRDMPAPNGRSDHSHAGSCVAEAGR